jgi:hypothetical protein
MPALFAVSALLICKVFRLAECLSNQTLTPKKKQQSPRFSRLVNRVP